MKRVIMSDNKNMKQRLFQNFKSLNDEGAFEDKESDSFEDTTLVVDISYLFKSHFSTNTDVTESGIPIAGISGVINNINKFVNKFNAQKVICAFDGVKSRKRRRQILESYKAQRDEQSDITSPFDIDQKSLQKLEKAQMRVLYELIGMLPVKRLYFKELEADDIIGYITKTYYEGKKGRRIIISEDRDFYQLIDDHTQVYHPRKKLLVHRKNFRDQWDTIPENVIYYRIIEGDSSDNIDGVRGWGIKTIEKYFPELKSEEIESIDEFLELVESKKSELLKTKTGTKIINQYEVLEPYHVLMDLSKTMLNTNEKMSLKTILEKKNKNPIMDFTKFKNRVKELNLMGSLHMSSINMMFNSLKY